MFVTMARGETEGAVIEIGFLDGFTTMREDRKSKFAKARRETAPRSVAEWSSPRLALNLGFA